MFASQQQQMVELYYDFIIKEPSFLVQKKGECVYSPMFFAKANDKIRWRLKIFPNEGAEESKDFLGLYLERVLEPGQPAIVVKFKVLGLLKNEKKIEHGQFEFQKEMGHKPLDPALGWAKLVDKSLIVRHGQLTDSDELKICCQIIYTI